MPLTELQLPPKQGFYSEMQSLANQIKKLQLRLTEVSEFVSNMDASTMDAMSISPGDVRTDLNNFRYSMDSIVTELSYHDTVIDKIRTMMVV